MIHIDGSRGEGGGQVLRSSLSLSTATGKPFQIEDIRANRKKPGLMRQHLTAVNAAAEVSGAEVQGNQIGSSRLTFSPDLCRAGEYKFSVGTAGSATLVLQTVLPALCLAEGTSTLVLEGGTHNPWAPPYDFLERAFLPLLKRMGPRVDVSIEKYGFYPAGGGRFHVKVDPVRRLASLELMERGEVIGRRARALYAKLPGHIGKREVNRVIDKMCWGKECACVEEILDSPGPGNIVLVEVECERVTEVFCGFGQRGVPSESVADQTVEQVRDYLAVGVPVGRHLADQLMIPIALAGGGKFRTLSLSRHSETNLGVIKEFLDLRTIVTKQDRQVVDVEIAERGQEGEAT